ncbi:aminotransferase class IV [Ramlibacter sp. H39-3-26]|uniref:aminotransferase class IV n=1 Tax=Curvibacter soli TaxID=3031331 RepID=UPI0023DBC623|nr:aminotransferase class IV [Ramlibacter sp. H39-3-26]MDF1484560.1 aminotransferase class IV [Ramlibacter sp. H39-3-26]
MTSLPDTPCYLNGEFTPLRDAKISVLDRGFIFGDGVYEVVPVYGGHPLRLAQHLARLDRSLAELRIANPLAPAQWHAVIARLLMAAPAADQLVYIQITRGVALRDHAMTTGIAPTVFAMAQPMKPVPAGLRARGAACVSADDFRWQKGHIKSTSLLGAVLARQISVDADATETVLFRDGWLTEASSSNVWVVRGDEVIGTPKGPHVLEGIRYGLIEELCEEAGLRFALRPVARQGVFAADELLLSSATKEVLAVTQLDGQPIGKGVPGPVYERLYAAYQRAKVRSAASEERP